MDGLNILFICTGNTCRSPMAAAIASDILTKEGISARVSSAGVYADGSSPASGHSLTVMREMGLDISEHRSRTADAEAILAASVVLTMTRGHKRTLLSLFPEEHAKIFTLAEFSESLGDVPDPFGMDEAAYRLCAGQISEMLKNCVNKFKILP